jgi:hypothetical protein
LRCRKDREETAQKPPSAFASYDIVEHVHRFASWAAVTAARRDISLSGREGLEIIEKVDLRSYLMSPSTLPSSLEFDEAHKRWRAAVIKIAKVPFSHGRAAKLVNVYLEAGRVGRSPGRSNRSARNREAPSVLDRKHELGWWSIAVPLKLHYTRVAEEGAPIFLGCGRHRVRRKGPQEGTNLLFISCL